MNVTNGFERRFTMEKTERRGFSSFFQSFILVPGSSLLQSPISVNMVPLTNDRNDQLRLSHRCFRSAEKTIVIFPNMPFLLVCAWDWILRNISRHTPEPCESSRLFITLRVSDPCEDVSLEVGHILIGFPVVAGCKTYAPCYFSALSEEFRVVILVAG